MGRDQEPADRDAQSTIHPSSGHVFFLFCACVCLSDCCCWLVAISSCSLSVYLHDTGKTNKNNDDINKQTNENRNNVNETSSEKQSEGPGYTKRHQPQKQTSSYCTGIVKSPDMRSGRARYFIFFLSPSFPLHNPRSQQSENDKRRKEKMKMRNSRNAQRRGASGNRETRCIFLREIILG